MNAEAEIKVEGPALDVDVTYCGEHYAACIAYAKKIGKWDGDDGLLRQLQHLVRIGRNCGTGKPKLWQDSAPYSFMWTAGGMTGGLIYHGSHDGGGDGGAPTFSVNQSPVDGWSLHS